VMSSGISCRTNQLSTGSLPAHDSQKRPASQLPPESENYFSGVSDDIE